MCFFLNEASYNRISSAAYMYIYYNRISSAAYMYICYNQDSFDLIRLTLPRRTDVWPPVYVDVSCIIYSRHTFYRLSLLCVPQW